LCKARATALSPASVTGAHHTGPTILSDAAIEAIHRVRTDPGRISEGWFLTLLAAGLSEEAYAELVSVVAVVTAVDTFHRGVGLLPPALPDAVAGAPHRRRPIGVRPGTGFLPTLAPEDRAVDDPDLYRSGERYGANIHRALSLVPDSMIHWWDLMEALYQSSGQMRDFAHQYRAISHAQIEMVAARVAANNACEY
jgi:hypothetical protein